MNLKYFNAIFKKSSCYYMSILSFNVFSVTQQENAVEADTVGLTLILS